MSNRIKKSVTITDLFPELGDEERAKVEGTIRQYLGVVKRIYDYISTNNPSILTELRKRARLRKKREIS